MTAVNEHHATGQGQGPKFTVDIEGTLHPWDKETITTEEIIALGGWDPSLGAIVIDKDQNKVGPSLQGVIGRTAGTHADFKYSQAMIDAGKGGLVWDDAKLAEYLRNPRAKVKGTKMVFPGLKKDEEIANVIAYMKQHPK